MLRQMLRILEVGVLLFVERFAESASAEEPYSFAVLEVIVCQLEFNISVFQSVS